MTLREQYEKEFEGKSHDLDDIWDFLEEKLDYWDGYNTAIDDAIEVVRVEWRTNQKAQKDNPTSKTYHRGLNDACKLIIIGLNDLKEK